jgi:hypothetical protein
MDLLLEGEYLPSKLFTLLHAVTGMDAAVTLIDHLAGPEAVLVWRGAAHALLAMRISFVGAYPAYPAVPSPRDARLFGALVDRAIETLDDHAIKLATTLSEVDDSDALSRRSAVLARWLDRIG